MRLVAVFLASLLLSVVLLWWAGTAAVALFGLSAQRAMEVMIAAAPTGSGDFWVVQALWSGVYGAVAAILITLAWCHKRARKERE
jgi:heme/copper-type cytochrome/quinol oxidase subunit 2